METDQAIVEVTDRALAAGSAEEPTWRLEAYPCTDDHATQDLHLQSVTPTTCDRTTEEELHRVAHIEPLLKAVPLMLMFDTDRENAYIHRCDRIRRQGVHLCFAFGIVGSITGAVAHIVTGSVFTSFNGHPFDMLHAVVYSTAFAFGVLELVILCVNDHMLFYQILRIAVLLPGITGAAVDVSIHAVIAPEGCSPGSSDQQRYGAGQMFACTVPPLLYAIVVTTPAWINILNLAILLVSHLISGMMTGQTRATVVMAFAMVVESGAFYALERCRRDAFILTLQTTRSHAQVLQLMADRARQQHQEILAKAEIAHQVAVSEALMERTKAELLEAQVARLKLQLLTSASSAISEGPNRVIREAREREAWTERWLAPNLNTDDDSRNATMLCLAVSTLDGLCFTAHMLRGASLGKEMKLKPGSHAFVKVAGEDHIRMNLMACEFGEASGHPKLANEQPVLYAGA